MINYSFEKKEKKWELWYILSLLLLSFSCLNAFEKGSFFFLVFCLIGFIFTYRRGQTVSNYFILYFFCSIAVVLSSLLYFPFSEVIKSVNYLLPFIVGYNLVINAKERDKTIAQVFFAVFAGFAINVIIIYFYNIGIQRESVRTLYSFWTKEPIAVTGVGLLVSVLVGYMAYVVVGRKSLFLKILAAVSLCFGLLLAIDTATRTPLFLALVVFVIVNYIYIRSNRGERSLRFIFISGLVIVGFIIVYVNDIFGIKTLFESSNIFKRFKEEGVDTPRWEISLEHFKLMPKYLWGGGNIRGELSEYAHNVWQDGYDNFGFLFLIPFLFISIHWFLNWIKIIKLKNKNSIDYLLLSVQLAVMIQFFVEPIISGYPVLLWCMFLFDGISTAYFIKRGV